MKQLFKIVKNSKSLWLLLFFCGENSKVYSQYNLVPNSSFEVYITCPNTINDPPPLFWYQPTSYQYQNGLYSNSCSMNPLSGVPRNGDGYQYAHTGQAYVILETYDGNNSSRFYFQTKLKDSLKMGHCYYIEFFVSASDKVTYGSNNVALLLTKKTVYIDTLNDPRGVLNANPQILNYGNQPIDDTLNWIKVGGIYTALGGEQYITIGNFKEDNQTSIKSIQPFVSGLCNCAGYYLDDVSVIPLDSMPLQADAGRDTTIHTGDSVFIGSLTNGIDTIKWLQNGIIPIDSTRPGFWVHPLVNTCYVLTQTVNGYSSSDTVCVNVQPLPLKFIQFTAAPTPPKVGLIQAKMDWETVNEINVSHFNIQRSINGRDFITIGTVRANNKENNKYNYIDGIRNWELGISKVYYRIEAVDFDGRKQYSGIRNVELGIRNGVSVYPNPAKDVVHVMGKDIKEVRIINYLGQLVHKEIALLHSSQLLAMTSNTQLLTINCTLLTKGLYMVQIILTNGTIKNEKLVVE